MRCWPSRPAPTEADPPRRPAGTAPPRHGRQDPRHALRPRWTGIGHPGRRAIGKTNKGLAELLKPEQMRHNRQIQLQQLGLKVFDEPDVQTRLRLTDGQIGRIRRIDADFQRSL